MKKTATFIVVGVMLSTIPAHAFDGGRGMQIALAEEKNPPVGVPVATTAYLDGQQKITVTECQQLRAPNDGNANLTVIKGEDGKGAAMIAYVPTHF